MMRFQIRALGLMAISIIILGLTNACTGPTLRDQSPWLNPDKAEYQVLGATQHLDTRRRAIGNISLGKYLNGDPGRLERVEHLVSIAEGLLEPDTLAVVAREKLMDWLDLNGNNADDARLLIDLLLVDFRLIANEELNVPITPEQRRVVEFHLETIRLYLEGE